MVGQHSGVGRCITTGDQGTGRGRRMRQWCGTVEYIGGLGRFSGMVDRDGGQRHSDSLLLILVAHTRKPRANAWQVPGKGVDQ
jgi:hypothetical protein